MKRLAIRLASAASLLLIAMAATSGQALAGDVNGALAYVPQDFTSVLAIDVESMSKSPIYKMFRDEVFRGSNKKELDKFKAATGFDVMTDIKSIVVAGPDQMMRGRSQSFLIVLEGNFDEKRIVAFAKKEGAPIAEKQGPDGAFYDMDGEGSIAFRDGYAIIAPTAIHAKALAAKKSGKSARTGGALSKLIAAFKGSKSGFAVSTSGDIVKDVARDVPGLSKFVGAGVGFDLTRGLALRISTEFSDAAAAGDLHKTLVDGMAEIANDQDMKDAGFADLVAKAKTAVKGKSVTVDVALSDDDVKKLLDMVR